MTPQEKIDIIRAQEDGKKIQHKVKGRGSIGKLARGAELYHEYLISEWGLDWCTCSSPCHFAFLFCDYRIKPSPREFWINKYAFGTYVHATPEAAVNAQYPSQSAETIHVREVLDA